MRADKNQSEIVKALRKIGASVHITNQVGNGFPDVVVGIFGKNYLFEIKNEKSGKLNKQQQEFHQRWNGKVYEIRTFEEALKIINGE